MRHVKVEYRSLMDGARHIDGRCGFTHLYRLPVSANQSSRTLVVPLSQQVRDHEHSGYQQQHHREIDA
jgi:hypothetical protein